MNIIVMKFDHHAIMYLPDLLKLSLLVPSKQPSPSQYHTLDFFTQHHDNSSITTNLPNFGLSPEFTWDSLLNELETLNKAHSKYKLFFLARHGEAWHNVLNSLPDWDEVSKHDTFENYTLFDDDLTYNGIFQIGKVNQYWIDNIKQNNTPFPEIFYTSPLKRTLHTFNITWSNHHKTPTPIVVENLREKYGVSTPERRHSKSWIKSYCPSCHFLTPFTEYDELWEDDKIERGKHVRERVKDWLDEVFKRDEVVISVTSHSGTIKQLLRVLGHPEFRLAPGELIPVVVRQSITVD